MKIIQKIVNIFAKEEKKVLGRWTIEHCDKKMNTKIDLSNEDPCGPCGQYILYNQKISFIASKNITSKQII
jgi:hypothetical protein